MNPDILGPELETTKCSNNMSDGDSGVSMATGDSKLNESQPGTPFIQSDRGDEIPSGKPFQVISPSSQPILKVNQIIFHGEIYSKMKR